MEDNNIFIEAFESELVTVGLRSLLGKEVRLPKGQYEDSLYEEALRYLINYVIEGEKPVVANDTIAYHSWLLKFVEFDDNYLEIWEVDEIGSSFVVGIDLSLKIILDQSQVCSQYQCNIDFPTFSQKVVISDGVLDDEPIQAVRYSEPSHMTGWYLTTSQYSGDPDSLHVIYYYDLVFRKPELLKYLALPIGYRFSIYKNELDVWFDEVIVNGD